MEIIDKVLSEDIPLKDRADIPSGGLNDYLSNNIIEPFLRKRFEEFPKMCIAARRDNIAKLKMMLNFGHKTPTKYIAGKVYDGTSGWSKDKNFKFNWSIPNNLYFFMRHIDPHFWDDENSKVRDNFMKGLLRGDAPFDLLEKVHYHYGTYRSKISKKAVVY